MSCTRRITDTASTASMSDKPDLQVQLHVHAPRPTRPFVYGNATPVKGYVTGADGVSTYYEVHGLEGSAEGAGFDSRPKVVMVMGLACGCAAWRWQLQDLLQPQQQRPAAPSRQRSTSSDGSFVIGTNGGCEPQQPQQQPAGTWSAMVVCVLDNRGMGLSSAPKHKRQYSTRIMAQDVLKVMDHLKWEAAHVCGFSLGGMISTKLAVIAPQRVLSLTLISATAGGWQTLPSTWQGMKMALKMVMARTPEDAADATLHFHFTKRTLREWIAHHRAPRKDLLRREYLAPSDMPAQPPHGFKGQLHACWTHSVSDADVKTIRSANFPVAVIHGRHDLLAAPEHGEALARRLHAPLILLEGAHFTVRECAGQINMLLASLVLGQRHIAAVSNDMFLEPDAAMLRAWREGQAAAAAVDAAVQACAA